MHLVSIVCTCQIEGEPSPSLAEIAELRVGPDDLNGLSLAAICRLPVEDYFKHK